MQSKIRRFESSDLGAIVKITENSWKEYPGSISLRKEEDFMELIPKFIHFLVSEIGNQIAGYITTFDEKSGYRSDYVDWFLNGIKGGKWSSF